ncbi:MbcA/ParS/Xre antitoxin family protein, partial [Aeromonas caviae]|uniref:MbcA/ParS/Xre antitoxin family protein n=1 Tax=Aeromonas caviae TaxID=648 RepID=UPI002B487F42
PRNPSRSKKRLLKTALRDNYLEKRRDAALSLQEDDALRALSWLHRPARGLGGVAPATLLTTQMGVQAVIDLVGRIQHGVCI